MSILFFILSFLCILYFGVIVFYSGIATELCGVWILLAVLFVLMGVFIRYEKKHREGMPNRLHIFVYTTFGLAAVLTSILLASVLTASRGTEKNGCDYIVLPGSTVYSDGMSVTLKNRLDRALAYHADNPETVFVLSGGKTEEDSVGEALAMYSYLSARGIPEGLLVIETESLTLPEKIRLSLAAVEEDITHRMIPPPIVVGILTSDYNVLRAMNVASGAGDMDLYGISAPSDPILFAHHCISECIHITEDFFRGE